MPSGGLRFAAAWNGSYFDETAYVREEFGISVRRQRQNQLSKFDASTMDLSLDNRKRRFDPDNASGSLFNMLLPDVQVQLLLDYPYLPGLLTNPQFESGTTGWTKIDSSDTLTIQTSAPFEGGQYARLTSGNAGRSVSDGVTNSTTTITSATAAFTAADIGKRISDFGDIPANTFIASVTNSTTAVMTNAATGSHTGRSLTIAFDLGLISSPVPAKVGDVLTVAYRATNGTLSTANYGYAIYWYSDVNGTTQIGSPYYTPFAGSQLPDFSGQLWFRSKAGAVQTAPASTQSFRVRIFSAAFADRTVGSYAEFDAVVADNTSTNGMTALWTGYIDKLPQLGDDARDAWVTLSNTDLFKILSKTNANHSGITVSVLSDVNANLVGYRHGYSFGDSPGGNKASDDMAANTISTEGAIDLGLFGSGWVLGADSPIPMETSTCLQLKDTTSYAFFDRNGIGGGTGPGMDLGTTIEAWLAADSTFTYRSQTLYSWACQWHPGGGSTTASEWILSHDSSANIVFTAGVKTWTWNATTTGFSLDGKLHYVALEVSGVAGTAPSLWVDGVKYAASSAPGGGPSAPTSTTQTQFIIGGTPYGLTKGTSGEYSGFVGRIQYWTLCVINNLSLSIASRYTSGSGWPVETTGNRIARVIAANSLTQIGTVGTTIDAGVQNIPAPVESAVSGQPIQQYFDKIALSEAGRFFVNRAGLLRLINRRAIAKTPYNAIQATFGSGTGEIPFSHAAPTIDDQLIYTEAVVTRDNGGVAQRVQNAAGVAKFKTITYQQTVYCQQDVEAFNYAQYVAQLYGVATPPRRIEQVVFKLESDAAWAEFFVREIGDLIAVRVRPPGITPGTYVQYLVFVEGISFDAHHGVIEVTYQTSGYGVQPNWLILNDAAAGKLNTGTLAF